MSNPDPSVWNSGNDSQGDVQPGLAALVTGAGSPRLGNAIARRLAQQGYRVALHAHRSLDGAQATVGELQAYGMEAMAVEADLCQEDQVASMVQQVVARFGRIDALVNCAAIWEQKALERTTAEDVRRHFEVNVLGTFLCSQQVGAIMVTQAGGGAIVNLGDWAVQRPYLNYAAYFASKGAIESLTKSFAVELASRNNRVRVNALLPGPVMLPKDMPAEERERAIAGTLLHREGRPEHVAEAVLFLLTNEFVTGVCVPVDGGRTIAG